MSLQLELIIMRRGQNEFPRIKCLPTRGIGSPVFRFPLRSHAISDPGPGKQSRPPPHRRNLLRPRRNWEPPLRNRPIPPDGPTLFVVVILGRDARLSLVLNPQPSTLVFRPATRLLYFYSVQHSAPSCLQAPLLVLFLSTCSGQLCDHPPRITNLVVILYWEPRSLFLAASSAQPLSGNLKTPTRTALALPSTACQPPNQPKASRTSLSSWQSFSQLASSSGDSWRSSPW